MAVQNYSKYEFVFDKEGINVILNSVEYVRCINLGVNLRKYLINISLHVQKQKTSCKFRVSGKVIAPPFVFCPSQGHVESPDLITQNWDLNLFLHSHQYSKLAVTTNPSIQGYN